MYLLFVCAKKCKQFLGIMGSICSDIVFLCNTVNYGARPEGALCGLWLTQCLKVTVAWDNRDLNDALLYTDYYVCEWEASMKLRFNGFAYRHYSAKVPTNLHEWFVWLPCLSVWEPSWIKSSSSSKCIIKTICSRLNYMFSCVLKLGTRPVINSNI